MKHIRLTFLALILASACINVSCSGHRANDYESSDKVNGSSGTGYSPTDSQKANGPQAAGNTYDTLTEGKATGESAVNPSQTGNSN